MTAPLPALIPASWETFVQVEKIILNQQARIEFWFREQWQKTPAPLTSSVDLRHAGFKLTPVDTNLFPAGFNNLNQEFLPLCAEAVRAALKDNTSIKNILILPENHTRNQFYLKSLKTLQDIFINAGFKVRIGSLDEQLKAPLEMFTADNECLLIEPLLREGNQLMLADFIPQLLVLNNDLSSGLPEILVGLKQPIKPTAQLGWFSRLKSSHFQFFEGVAEEFSALMEIDPWLINPYFQAIDNVDFMAKEGVENLAEQVEKLLAMIQINYDRYHISEKPFVVMKADNGTYGMSVMMVHAAEEVYQLNRKQRTRMAASKGGRKVERVLIQEGVYTFETAPEGGVAEPVVYMMGECVVGGFYRVHQGRGKSENLNAPGMHFEPLAFTQSCNAPRPELATTECSNRFYTYGVIARLAALAAAREMAATGES